MQLSIDFGGSHTYLDSSPHYRDLRGRNVLLNATRWLAAVMWDAKAVHVNVEHLEKKPSLDAIRAINHLIAPARAESVEKTGEGREERVYSWAEIGGE